jgi:hypothetical protein
MATMKKCLVFVGWSSWIGRGSGCLYCIITPPVPTKNQQWYKPDNVISLLICATNQQWYMTTALSHQMTVIYAFLSVHNQSFGWPLGSWMDSVKALVSVTFEPTVTVQQWLPILCSSNITQAHLCLTFVPLGLGPRTKESISSGSNS